MRNRNENSNIFYLIFLMIVLIFMLLISFWIGEGIYYFLNTSLGVQASNSNTEIADWSFVVRIEY